ncbi:MAG: FeoA family protein [Kiritimatiellia bacterium]
MHCDINTSNGPLKLSTLPPGTCCVVTDVGTPADLDRLKSMGICLGRTLEVVKAGDPLIVRVYGTRIGLSIRLADHIQVETCAEAPRCWEKRAFHAE